MDYDDVSSSDDTIWIIESDDEDTVPVATEKDSTFLPGKTAAYNQDINQSGCSKVTRFSLRKRNAIKHSHSRHSSCSACELDQKHSPSHKFNAKILKKPKNKCEICRKLYCSSYDLQVHRMGHLMPDTIHCSVCLRIFDENGEKTKHESKCKLLRYECYLCRKTLRDRGRCTQHLRWHTHKPKQSALQTLKHLIFFNIYCKNK